jgi:hypothetical protein
VTLVGTLPERMPMMWGIKAIGLCAWSMSMRACVNGSIQLFICHVHKGQRQP